MRRLLQLDAAGLAPKIAIGLWMRRSIQRRRLVGVVRVGVVGIVVVGVSPVRLVWWRRSWRRSHPVGSRTGGETTPATTTSINASIPSVCFLHGIIFRGGSSWDIR